MSNKRELNKMYAGFFETCDNVSKSMGAEGALGIIYPKGEFGAPQATKDGVSIGRSTFFDDDFKTIGSFYAKQATAKTLTRIGDATTTTLVFAKSLVKGTQKRKFPYFWKSEYFYNSKVREGFIAAQKEAEEKLKTIALPATEDKIYNVAKISANNDDEIASIVTNAYKAVGVEGVIDVQEDHDKTINTLTVTDGMLLHKGWVSPFLADQDTGIFEAENVNILIFEGNILPENASLIENFLKSKVGESVLIICERIVSDVVQFIEDVYKKKALNICVIEAPFFAEQRKAVLQDIALYTDGQVFVQSISENLVWGKADKVIINQDTTSIVKSVLSPEIGERIENLKEQLETTSEKEFFKKRIKQLSGKAALIKVGGVTDVSRKEIFDRVDDSVSAVKSAVAEGVVAGGGSSLIWVAENMTQKFSDKSVQFGYNVVKKALQSPYRTILSNAKVDHSKFISASKKELGKGYNVKTHKIEDLIETGVMDSVKGIRVALENAISVALIMLNTKMIVGWVRKNSLWKSLKLALNL
jgi:chaperonin GroEL